MVECNFSYEDEGIFFKKKVITYCQLKKTSTNGFDCFDTCDKDNCILQKILNKK